MGDTKIYNIENIDNAQFLGQSLDYQALMGRIEKKQQQIQKLQKIGETELALEIGAELQTDEEQLTQLKEDVLRLYETFTKIEIDTARLAKAKDHFDRGEFREADAILDAEAMGLDLDRLLEREQQLDKEKAAVAKGRGQLSNEYLVKAHLRATFYEQPNRFEEVCQYFEEALKAARTTEALFEYGVFLQEHNDFKHAQPLYGEAVNQYRELAQDNPRTYWPKVAMTLNNLAVLHKTQNNYELAVQSYKEALQIYRKLELRNLPSTYLPDVAMTLNNFAILHKTQNNYALAAQNYKEALQIYRKLDDLDDSRTYRPYAALTLNNLAVLYKDQNNYELAAQNYKEALQIYRELDLDNSRTYRSYIALTLNNLGIVQSNQNNYELAKQSYEEALRVRRELALENPRTYLPDVAATLNSWGLFQSAQNNYDLASQSFEEALQSYRKLALDNPRTYLSDIAMTLNNFAVLQSNQNNYELAEKSFGEALHSYRKLERDNPRAYLSYVALTLHNLGLVQSNQHNYERAEQSYEEALRSYRELTLDNSRTYLPYVAGTLASLSIFYLQAKPDKAQSVSMAKEVIVIAQAFPNVPAVQGYADTARQVLQAHEGEGRKGKRGKG